MSQPDGAPLDPHGDGPTPGPFSTLLGFRYISVDEHEAVVEADPGPEHCNGGGIVHGGFLSALLSRLSGYRDAATVLGDTYGFNDNTNPAPYSPHWDIATGLVMLISRLIPIIAPIALAASLAAKKPTPFTSGTLRTDTITFGFVLLGTILLIGALMFLPVAALGPMAEHFGPLPFGR